jgi:hypothetical protein
METFVAMKSLFSYHQLHRHSDAKCCNPCNPKGANANNAHCNDWNINCDCNYQNNQDNENNQQSSHHYPTRSQQQREETHQQQEVSNDHSQNTTIPSPMTKSLPWKKRAALTTMMKTSSPNKTMYQKLPLVN